MTAILIPARLDSTRFPKKPLAKIRGESMISRSVRIAQNSVEASHIKVLTDSKAILAEVPQGIGYLSEEPYKNGTERSASYAKGHLNAHSMVAILQGDEVTITGRDLDYAISRSYAHCVTTIVARVPSRPVTDDDVFVRTNPSGTVVEFKRGDPSLGFHHVGVYITSAYLLRKYLAAPQTSAEIHERLEQHRWESIGVGIQAVYLPIDTESVNRPEDIQGVEKLLCQNASTLVGGPASK